MSRFIWDLSCGEKETAFFENAMAALLQVTELPSDQTEVTDGERRYGNLLFNICQEVIRTGKKGRPKTTLKEGVEVRVKNKGSQSQKTGPKHPKYHAPQPEHPETKPNLENGQILAQSCGNT